MKLTYLLASLRVCWKKNDVLKGLYAQRPDYATILLVTGRGAI